MAERKMRIINIKTKQTIKAVFYNVAFEITVNYWVKKLNFMSLHLIIDPLKVHGQLNSSFSF